jgi:hypothetical protein
MVVEGEQGSGRWNKVKGDGGKKARSRINWIALSER